MAKARVYDIVFRVEVEFSVEEMKQFEGKGLSDDQIENIALKQTEGGGGSWYETNVEWSEQ